jgi:hypothetical protein
MSALPYITAPGNVIKALGAILAAERPARVNAEFIHGTLGIPGSSGRQVGTWLKRMGLVNADDAPSALYDRLRDPAQTPSAAEEALRTGYAALYLRTPDAHLLPDEPLRELIREEMQLGLGSNVATLVLACFKALRNQAFPVHEPQGDGVQAKAEYEQPQGGNGIGRAATPTAAAPTPEAAPPKVQVAFAPPPFAASDTAAVAAQATQAAVLNAMTQPTTPRGMNSLRGNAALTIYLALPATSDAAVFSAIFQSLKDTLLG